MSNNEQQAQQNAEGLSDALKKDKKKTDEQPGFFSQCGSYAKTGIKVGCFVAAVATPVFLVAAGISYLSADKKN